MDRKMKTFSNDNPALLTRIAKLCLYRKGTEMGRDVVSAKLDIILKKLFSDENSKLLMDFVSGILEIALEEMTEITVTNPELPPESLNSKFCRLDLNLKTTNELINIENA